MSKPTISACVIAWNEATTIDFTLRSIAGFVDEVIISDTGSFDGTKKIAREWLDKLDLCGEVNSVRAKTLGQARVSSYTNCSGDWILLIDANLVLSDVLKNNLLKYLKHPRYICGVRSLNLMGDYRHYFSALKFHSFHQTFFRRDIMIWVDDVDRPRPNCRRHFPIPKKMLLGMPGWFPPKPFYHHVNVEGWAVNLSRVRPAWRCWYRGEPFDPRYSVDREHRTKSNTQYLWGKSKKYLSLVDFIESEMGYSLKDVKEIGPVWYLDQLNRFCVLLEDEYMQILPKEILEELRNPRYRLSEEEGKIIGRYPEL